MNPYKIIPIVLKRTVLCLLIIVNLACITSVTNAEDIPIFKGLPPSGEEYFTACIECSNIDELPGAELVITDDYGSFQILSWDPFSRTFFESWVSDQVFDTHRIKKIALPYDCHLDESYIVFVDTANDLRIFHWREYFISEVGVIHLSSLRNYNSISDFMIADFLPDYPGWEILTFQIYQATINRNSFSLGLVNVGQFNPAYHTLKTTAIMGMKSEPELILDHQKCDDPHGILVISKIEDSQTGYEILRGSDPFGPIEKFTLELNPGSKIGWTGEIDNSGYSYLTCFHRSEDVSSEIRFYKLDGEAEFSFEIDVPLNTSKWVLGDLDGDGIRELIVLDFLGNLYVYSLKNKFSEVTF